MFVPPVMLVRQARGQGRQARGPQAPVARCVVPHSAVATSASLNLLITCSLRRMSPLGHLSPFYGPILTYYLRYVDTTEPVEVMSRR